MGLTLVVVGASASAQDPGMQATQAAQQAAQISMQAAQQATDQAMRDAQMASQNAMSAQQQAAMNASASSPCCYTGTPKFSVKPGAYSSPITVKMHAGYGAVIYYTTDGWTPTTASKRYRGPITIDSTTTLQAIAVSRYGGRSRLAIAAYTLAGASPAPSVAQSATADFALNSAPDSASNSAAAAPESGKLLLAQGTPVPLVFASDVSSKTADVGDKISLTLGEDLKAGNVVVVKKGTPTVATVTEVDKPRMMGVPGAVYFEVDSLKAGDAVIKLHGGEAKEGQDQAKKAMALIAVPVVPVALFVHGKDAEIKQGATFTAFVDVDALLPPAN
jgi:hypothetical protein